MNKSGFTLTEVLITVGILSILLAIGGMSYSTFMARYRMENQVRELYTDIQNARARAMQKNLDHFVIVSTAFNYRVIEDTNDDGEANEAAFTTRPLAYAPDADLEVTIDKRGLIDSINTTIRFSSAATGAVLDCIVLDVTRIKMGKLNGTVCTSQ
jgi:prepilin-type N-terminal cleavage/methylation domain-containing protein